MAGAAGDCRPSSGRHRRPEENSGSRQPGATTFRGSPRPVGRCRHTTPPPPSAPPILFCTTPLLQRVGHMRRRRGCSAASAAAAVAADAVAAAVAAAAAAAAAAGPAAAAAAVSAAASAAARCPILAPCFSPRSKARARVALARRRAGVEQGTWLKRERAHPYERGRGPRLGGRTRFNRIVSISSRFTGDQLTRRPQFACIPASTVLLTRRPSASQAVACWPHYLPLSRAEARPARAGLSPPPTLATGTTANMLSSRCLEKK